MQERHVYNLNKVPKINWKIKKEKEIYCRTVKTVYNIDSLPAVDT